MTSARLGLVGLGDSITHGEGNPALGVPARSWAEWLARALELPYTCLAVQGAVADDVVRGQLRRLAGRYDLGCLYVGVNDARGLHFDVAAFEPQLRRAAAGLAACCDRLLMLTIPLDLGRPRAGDSVVEANAAIRRLASARGATLVVLDDLRGWRLVLPDAVHLTAVGQLEVAERAAAALAQDGVVLRVRPAQLVTPHRSRARALSYLLTRQSVGYLIVRMRSATNRVRLAAPGRGRR